MISSSSSKREMEVVWCHLEPLALGVHALAREEALAESRQELELSATSEPYCDRCDRLTAQSVTFIQAAPPGGAGGKCVDVRRARCKECGLRTRT